MDRVHVFISYSSLDFDFALKLATDLKERRIRVWMDKLGGIQIGDDWPEKLETAIIDCCAIVPIISPRYSASNFARSELLRALALNKPVFPVIYEKGNTPLEIERLQYLDFTVSQLYDTQLIILATKLASEFASAVYAGDEGNEGNRSNSGIVIPTRASEQTLQTVVSAASNIESLSKQGWQQAFERQRQQNMANLIKDEMDKLDAVYRQLTVTGDLHDRLRLQKLIQVLTDDTEKIIKQL